MSDYTRRIYRTIAAAAFFVLVTAVFFVSKTLLERTLVVLLISIAGVCKLILSKQQRQLNSNGELFSIMTETTGGCYWEWNVNNRSLRLIPDGISIFGKGVNTGDEFIALLHPDDAHLFEKNLDRFFVTDPSSMTEHSETEFRVQSRQGEWRWFAMRVSRVVRSSGNVAMVMGAMMDVDAYRRAADALRSSEARLGTIFNNGPGSMAVTDADGKLLEANQAFCDMLGYSAKNLQGVMIMSLSAVKYEKEGPALMAHILRECENNEDTHFRREEDFVRSDGNIITLDYGVAAIYDFDGNIFNYIFSGVDLTLQKKHYAELQASRSELDTHTQQLHQLHSLISSLLTMQNRKHLFEGTLEYLKCVIPDSVCAVYLFKDNTGGDARMELMAWYDEDDIHIPDNALVQKAAYCQTPLAEYTQTGLESRRVSPIVFQSRIIGAVDIYKPLGMTPKELKIYQLLIDYVSSLWVLYDVMALRDEEASVDPLTGIWNRRYMIRRFQEEADRITRYGGSICVVIGDMGNFKDINDKWGHSKGDEVLIKVAMTIKKCLRASDSVGRYGGDEFLLLLPRIAKADSDLVLERIKTELEQLMIKSGNDDADSSIVDVVIDFGLAMFPVEASTLPDAIKLADGNMYTNKMARKKRMGLQTTREGVEFK